MKFRWEIQMFVFQMGYTPDVWFGGEHLLRVQFNYFRVCDINCNSPPAGMEDRKFASMISIQNTHREAM